MDLSDQKTQIMLLAILGGLGLIYAWFTYIYSPRSAEIGTLEGDISTLQGEISTLQVKVNQSARVQAQLAQIQAEWNRVLVSFPTQPKEDEVFANLSSAEQTSGLFIRQLQPGERRVRQLYIEQDYTISMVGRYHQLGDFIESIAAMPRRMAVRRMQLLHPSVAQGAASGGATSLTLTPQEDEVIIQCTVTTYVVRTSG